MNKLFLVLILSLVPAYSFASDEDEDYESIVSRLSAQPEVKVETDSYNLDHVLFHVGLGVAHSAFSLADERVDQTVDQAGFNLMLGVDLLSPLWLAEIAYINYYQSREGDLKTKIQEFDLKILYRNSFTSLLGYRIGAGLAARYLNLEKLNVFSDNYSTPATILAAGIEAKITSTWSIVTEASMKNAIVADSPEKRAIDFMLRIDGHL